MVDFMNTQAGHEFAANVKSLMLSLTRKENKEEALAANIYANLVSKEFYEKEPLSNEELKKIALEAAKDFYKS